MACAHRQLVNKMIAYAHCQLKPENYSLLACFIPDVL